MNRHSKTTIACAHSGFSFAEPTKQNIMKDANCKLPKTGGHHEAGEGIAKVPKLGVGMGGGGGCKHKILCSH